MSESYQEAAVEVYQDGGVRLVRRVWIGNVDEEVAVLGALVGQRFVLVAGKVGEEW